MWEDVCNLVGGERREANVTIRICLLTHGTSLGQALQIDLQTLDLGSTTLLQYADDLL